MNKVLITGAGSGLGKELALVYSENNEVILIGRNKEKLDRVKEIIEKNGGKACAISLDITKANHIDDVLRIVENKYKSINTLVNCAGVGYFGPFKNIKDENINTMIDVNVKGTIMMTRKFIPIVKEKIINIISTAGLKGKPNEAVYVASKFAIRGFSESLQNEYKDEKLKITAVYMGGMNTPFWDGKSYIKDKSRLKSAKEVAKQIFISDDGRKEIVI
ncbi:SDR family NAD(P)-dependent oxidoreductase [Helicovermis profundi]|uniref:SDR family oxidoreductase n=1 Tax=Helicovermis profundi TaxID=3065157 RepID=A0AAU9EGY6_9FIRM|nr:SDR family oxidoreductase [Clostridia bacterium S502]